MKSATILVIDGFGIGAMPDAGLLRKSDTAADTLGSVSRFAAANGVSLSIPTLAYTLGLAALRPDLQWSRGIVPKAAPAGFASLGYPGADSYAGHQALMCADMSKIALARVAEFAEKLSLALRAAGHSVVSVAEGKNLLIDNTILVHDNLESDPALTWNVSTDLSRESWYRLEQVTQLVRSVAPVGRVIAVGGISDGNFLDYTRDGDDGTFGLDTPACGFYRNPGLRVRHFGASIDTTRQLHELAASCGMRVNLVGKAADLLKAHIPIHRYPGVRTSELLSYTESLAGCGLTVANIQETDLAGHSQDPGSWLSLLSSVDDTVTKILSLSTSEHLLIVTGDHGNDPCIGHNFHTREFVPVLASIGRNSAVLRRVKFDSLSSIGATVAAWLDLPSSRLGAGRPFSLSNRTLETPPHG